MTEGDEVPWSPIGDRPPLRWPDGCRLAVWVCPNLEHYDYLPPPQRRRDPWPRMPHPDVLGYGQRDYGNRVGVWRLFDLLDHHGIRATVSGGLTCFARYDAILQGCLDRGWDCMCHGFENSSYLWDMPREEEQALVQRAVDTFRDQFGRPLEGWFSPAASHTANTLDLVAAAGVRYFCDWYHDEQPFPIFASCGPIITLPYSMEYNDIVLRLRGQEVGDFIRMIREGFEVLWNDGATQGRVLCIALHPFVSGQPHWVRPLDRLFRELRQRPGVWWTTGSEMSRWYYANHLPAMLRHLGAGGTATST